MKSFSFKFVGIVIALILIIGFSCSTQAEESAEISFVKIEPVTGVITLGDDGSADITNVKIEPDPLISGEPMTYYITVKNDGTVRENFNVKAKSSAGSINSKVIILDEGKTMTVEFSRTMGDPGPRTFTFTVDNAAFWSKPVVFDTVVINTYCYQDNDKDGVIDLDEHGRAIDNCPDQKEDLDGCLDSDGCPDPDKINEKSCLDACECSGGYCVHGICRSVYLYCGDGYCDRGETCSSCPSDCPCPSGKICCSGSCKTPACNSNSDCDDRNSCTTDTCKNAGTCYASCSHITITSCINSDGCCLSGCNSINDNDCSPICGNDLCESGETYSSCLSDCKKPDGEPCSYDSECINNNCFKKVCREEGYCEIDSDCSSDQYCSDNKCENLKSILLSCSKDSECETENCFEGVCREQGYSKIPWLLIFGFILFLIFLILVYFVKTRRKDKKAKKIIAQPAKKSKPKKKSDKHKIDFDPKIPKIEQTMCPITKMKLKDIPEDKLYICPNMTCRTFYHYDAIKKLNKCVNCGRKITK